MTTSLANAEYIVVAIQTAFTDAQAILGHMCRQLFRGSQIRDHGFQIAVINAKQPAFQTHGTVHFVRVMYLNQHIHVPIIRHSLQLARLAIFQRRHDQQDAIGTQSPRLGDLIGLQHEILAQYRQIHGVSRLHQKIVMPLKIRHIREHREAGGAAPLIGLGQGRRIRIRSDQALGW